MIGGTGKGSRNGAGGFVEQALLGLAGILFYMHSEEFRFIHLAIFCFLGVDEHGRHSCVVLVLSFTYQSLDR